VTLPLLPLAILLHRQRQFLAHDFQFVQRAPPPGILTCFNCLTCMGCEVRDRAHGCAMADAARFQGYTWCSCPCPPAHCQSWVMPCTSALSSLHEPHAGHDLAEFTNTGLPAGLPAGSAAGHAICVALLHRAPADWGALAAPLKPIITFRSASQRVSCRTVAWDKCRASDADLACGKAINSLIPDHTLRMRLSWSEGMQSREALDAESCW
jgi:hypothetical protein